MVECDAPNDSLYTYMGNLITHVRGPFSPFPAPLAALFRLLAPAGAFATSLSLARSPSAEAPRGSDSALRKLACART